MDNIGPWMVVHKTRRIHKQKQETMKALAYRIIAEKMKMAKG